MNPNNKFFDLNKVIIAVLKKAWLIILITLFCAGTMLLYSKFLATPLYCADVSIYITNSTDINKNQLSSSDIIASQKLADTYMILAKSKNIISEVKNTLELNISEQEIYNSVSAYKVNNDSQIFYLSAKSSNNKKAAYIVNTFADIVVSEIPQTIKGSSAQIIDYAEVPTSYLYPNLIKSTIYGAIIGFFVSAFIIFIIELIISIKKYIKS